ncbi:hypothetical protein BD408DRAFT_175037 [Parasitella parasitica]|nr:hypothetical protein BD408DRAFT_175037 [Parasitella parasitica]
MATTTARFILIIFFISCSLVNLHQCYPNQLTAVTKAITPELTENSDFKTSTIKKAEERVRKAVEKARKAKERARERKEQEGNANDDDNGSSTSDISSSSTKTTSKQYKHHESKPDDDEDEGDKKTGSHENSKNDGNDGNTVTSTEPTNTVVTTIIVVATETPTTIYSDSSSGSAKQKSDTSKSPQVNDPNDGTSSSSSSSDSTESTDSSSNENSEESEAAAAFLHGQSAYRKLVTALSIVGGIAGIALITGGLVFTRMNMRKRKRKEADLEMAANDNSGGSQTPSRPTPPHSSPPSSPSSNHYARFSNDGGDTIINFNQDPFSDPADLSYSRNMIRSLDYRMSLTPTAPPSQPVNLIPSHRYANYRQNQTLSMLSQTTATALPSAPSAKELDAFAYDNPFEDEGSGITEENEEELERLGQLQHPSITTLNAVPSITFDEESSLQVILSSPSNVLDAGSSPSSSSSVSASGPFHLEHKQHLQESQESFSSSADLPPPPAYTPSAPPSAPPLYMLPTSRLALEAERQQQRQQREEEGTRRHSISSCSIASSSRPLSLRRGSGSLAHISFK